MYIKNWPEDGSIEPKHVASYVLMIIYIIDKTRTHALFIQHYISLSCWFH